MRSHQQACWRRGTGFDKPRPSGRLPRCRCRCRNRSRTSSVLRSLTRIPITMTTTARPAASLTTTTNRIIRSGGGQASTDLPPEIAIAIGIEIGARGGQDPASSAVRRRGRFGDPIPISISIQPRHRPCRRGTGFDRPDRPGAFLVVVVVVVIAVGLLRFSGVPSRIPITMTTTALPLSGIADNDNEPDHSRRWGAGCNRPSRNRYRHRD